jgi:hypothetical protein
MPCYLNLKNCITTLRVVFLRELLSNLDLRVKFWIMLWCSYLKQDKLLLGVHLVFYVFSTYLAFYFAHVNHKHNNRRLSFVFFIAVITL